MSTKVSLGSQVEPATGADYTVITDGAGVPGYSLFTPLVKGAESLTTIGYNASTGLLSYLDEAGQTTNINLPIDNFLSDASYDPQTGILTLTLSNSTTVSVNLSDLVDTETVTTISRSGGTLTYTNEGAVAFTFVEGGPSSQAGNDITAGSDGKSFFQEKLTTISIAGRTITYNDELANSTVLNVPYSNFGYAEKVIGSSGTGASHSLGVSDAKTVLAVFHNGLQCPLASSISGGDITIVEPTFAATLNGAGGNTLSVLYLKV